MKFRKLRIAWSVACAIVCMLLIVLWVRSHTWMDEAIISLSNRNSLFGYSSVDRATLQFVTFDNNDRESRFFVYLPDKVAGDMAEIYRDEPKFHAEKLIESGWTEWTVWMPHWFATLLTATIATLPWLPWRFSLRTLLIATTLVAMGLGLVVYLARTH